MGIWVDVLGGEQLNWAGCARKGRKEPECLLQLDVWRKAITELRRHEDQGGVQSA